MKKYIGIIHHNEGSAYGVTFPDIEGCFAAADRDEDIITKAIEALTLHLEDEDTLPDARSAVELAKLPHVREALDAGGWMMAVPFIPTAYTTFARINISLNKGIIKAIDITARERGLTRSAFLEEAARRQIES